MQRKHSDNPPSSLGRRYLCPGSYRMEAQCGDDSSADAQAGEALHLAVETCNVADLSPDDAELVQKARTYLFGLADSWEFEHLCTIRDVTYGWADAIAVLPERVIVVDFKFVWLDLARIMATWQMAAYAVALYEEFHKPVEAYVYCPRLEQAFDCPPYPYEQTLVRIKEVIATSRRPDAPLHVQPEACKYCKARAICPELNRELSVVVAVRTQLTPTNRAKRREFLALVETWAERVRTEDRQFMLDGGEIPGWEIRKRQGPRFIPDPYTAWLHLHDHLSPSEIMSAVEMKIGKLEETASKRNGWGQTKSERVAFLNATLGHAVQRKPEYFVVVRSKESKGE